MYNEKKIKKKIDHCEYISFDIFDTLVKRNLEKPTDLFDFVEQKYNHKNHVQLKSFKELRIKAEQQARDASIHREPDINDIYSFLNLSNKEELKKLEIHSELELCQQNINFYSIYQYAKEKNKKIIITSDMYLEKETIKKILKNAKIDYDYLFLSNDLKLNKHHGKIYPYILEQLKIKPSNLLHIGDSKRADYINPKRYGIQSILIPKKINRLRYYNDFKYECLEDNIIKNFMNNNLPSRDIYYQIGYEILGILLLGYSKWLKTELKKENIKKVYFLSREGALLKKAFDLINDTDIESKYLYVSRRSTRVSLLKNIQTISDVFDVCKMRKIVDLDSFFMNVGLDVNDYIKLLKKYNVQKDTNIKEANNLQNLFDEIKMDIIDNAKKEEKNLISYLESQDFHGKLAISDIGWAGTMQNALQTLMKKTNIIGYYICQSPEAKKYVDRGQKQKAYLFDYQNQNFINVQMFINLFESFFLANHGTTIKYKDNTPILATYEYSSDVSQKFLSMQQGALDFIKNFHINLSINADTAFYGIKKLGIMPNLTDIKLFGNIHFLDGKEQYFAKPDPLYKYVFHPKKLYHDFGICGWKAGFIKRLFKIKFPYYKLLKKIYIKSKFNVKQ